jgi:hypothetical protein
MTQKFHESVEVYADDEVSGRFPIPGPRTITLDNHGNLFLKKSITLDGNNGDIKLYDKDGKHSFSLHGKVANEYTGLWIGARESEDGTNKPGKIFLRDGNGNDSITLDGKFQNISLSNRRITLQGTNSSIWLNDDAGNNSILVDGTNRWLTLQNSAGIQTIKLAGDTGDILLNSADCAEEFDVSEPKEMEAGTVMVIEEEGKLRQSMEAYDKKVAGVVSGAGDCKPAIVLDKKQSQVNRKAVALMGKVYCKVDAQSSPIEVGDLLTTSSTPGHAMKAADPLRAFGAVIGKALRPLKSGKSLIPILIALQ